jgi:hypothetical protein
VFVSGVDRILCRYAKLTDGPCVPLRFMSTFDESYINKLGF